MILSWMISIPLQLTCNPELDHNIFLTLIGLLVLVSAIYSILVFVQSNTGTTTDAILYTFIVISLPIFAYIAYHIFFYSFILGYSGNLNWDTFSYLSPVIAIFCYIYEAYSSAILFKIIIFWGIFAFSSGFLSQYIYRRVASEDAEKPFTNHIFFPVVSSAFCMILQAFLYSLFHEIGYNTTISVSLPNAILSIAMSMVIYLILDVIANRSYQHLLKAAFYYLVIGVGCFMILLPVNWTKGFGFIHYIPDTDDIQQVQILYNDPYGLFTQYDFVDKEYLFGLSHNEYRFTDEYDIEVVKKLHEQILNNYQQLDYDIYQFNLKFHNLTETYNWNTYENIDLNVRRDITFTYLLKDGSSVVREYSIDALWTGILLNISDSDAFNAHRIPVAYFNNKIHSYDTVTLLDPYKSISSTISDNNFSLKHFLDLYLKDHVQYVSKDITSLDYNFHGYIRANYCVVEEGKERCSESNLPVDSRYVSVMDYLNECGITFPQPKEDIIAYLVIPDEDGYTNNLPSISEYDYSDKQHEMNVIELTQQELVLLLPYLRYEGISDQETYKIIYNENFMSPYYDSSPGCLLIDPNGLSYVNEMIKDKPSFKVNTVYDLVYNKKEIEYMEVYN